MSFEPRFEITTEIASCLARIEAAKDSVINLPVTPEVLASLRETVRLRTTHYSTKIEGNRLSEPEVRQVIHGKEHFPGRKRDEQEVLGFYAALDYVEQLASYKKNLDETSVKKIHALVMGNGRKQVRPTPYRDGQNVIRDGATREIVYMPPVAKDVPTLIRQLIKWLAESKLSPPLKAGIAHYQYVTIHPYYDGNGRTARLLATLVLHKNGYSLKGTYCLEEYYSQTLADYYQALSLGLSHNYYFGRNEADITPWLNYFCEGMATSFEAIKHNAEEEEKKGKVDLQAPLMELEVSQRKTLELFKKGKDIRAKEVAEVLGVSTRTAQGICRKWVDEDFLNVYNPAKRNRSYVLSDRWKKLLLL